MEKRDRQESANLQYLGVAGGTTDCVDAIALTLQAPEGVKSALLLTYKEKEEAPGKHGFLLEIGIGDKLVIPPGFTSGYRGGGPNGLSAALCLLESLKVEIKEIDIDRDIYLRLEAMQLKNSDLDRIGNTKSIPGSSWTEYVSARDEDRQHAGTIWTELKPILPLPLIAPQLIDLVPEFMSSPDHALMIGYRRLEDAVRKKSNSNESSSKLMSIAFLGENARLTWEGVDPGEQTGRAQLFSGAYMAFRNKRAHREQIQVSFVNDIQEFLLLSLLYSLLESSSQSEKVRL